MNQYRNFREFLTFLEQENELKKISIPVSPKFEITEISSRVLKKQGPALIFENPQGYDVPVVTNLFGTEKRIALALGVKNIRDLKEIGKLLAWLKSPTPPNNFSSFWKKLPMLKKY